MIEAGGVTLAAQLSERAKRPKLKPSVTKSAVMTAAMVMSNAVPI